MQIVVELCKQWKMRELIGIFYQESQRGFEKKNLEANSRKF